MARIPMKNQASERRKSQSGNVFLLIFLAIAMFAGLTFALTQGMRSGESNLTQEKANLAATEIIDFLNKVKQTVDTLIISGCDPLKIDFTSDVYTRVNGTLIETAPSGTTESCKVFSPSGGGINPVKFSEYTGTGYPTIATAPIPGVASAKYADSGLGTSTHDLVYLFYYINLDICLAILNKVSNTGNSYTEVPVNDFTTAGSNSYTMGTPGTLTALTIPASSRIWAVKKNVSDNFCTTGIIMRVN